MRPGKPQQQPRRVPRRPILRSGEDWQLSCVQNVVHQMAEAQREMERRLRQEAVDVSRNSQEVAAVGSLAAGHPEPTFAIIGQILVPSIAHDDAFAPPSPVPIGIDKLFQEVPVYRTGGHITNFRTIQMEHSQLAAYCKATSGEDTMLRSRPSSVGSAAPAPVNVLAS